MASIIKVDRILDSTELGKVDIPGGIKTTELIADTWKNIDGTENYKCRAWVNFNGTTTPPTIRASGNVSSVVRNSTGNYTVNFDTPLPDANFAVCPGCGYDATADINITQLEIISQAAGSVNIRSYGPSSGNVLDSLNCNIAIFR